MSNEQLAKKAASSRLTIRTPYRAVVSMFLLNGALLGVWGSRIPAIVDKHQLSESLLGILLFGMSAGAILSFPLAGYFVDKYGSAPVTKRIAILFGLSLPTLALAPNIATLAIGLIIFGAAIGSMDVAMNAWAAEVEKSIGRSVMSSFHAMWSLGVGLGAGTGYLAVNLSAGPINHFLVAATLFLLIALIFGFIDWASPRKKQAAGTGKAPLFPIPKGVFALLGILGLCSALGEGAIIEWSAIFLQQVAGVDQADAALGLATFSVAMVIMRLVGDRIITKLGPVNTARASGVFIFFGAALAISMGTLSSILIGFCLMAVGYATIFPMIFTRAANDDQMSPGAAIAAVATFGYGGGLLGPVLIGFLADFFSIRWAFLTLPALAVVIVFLAQNLQPAQTRQPEN